MGTWGDFEAAAPAVAAGGLELLRRPGHDSGLLATVRGNLAPRIHPVSVGVVDGHLYVFVLDSAKLRDLRQDGRYALHAHVDLNAPDEFMARGHATEVSGAARARAAQGWFFEVDDSYVLFELLVESAVVSRRGADEWPPRYTTWSETPKS